MREQAYEEFCRQVCSAMKKATQKEKQDLSRELTDHMEDHVEALIDLGWDPEEARGYAVEAMGDPEVVGRQYDAQLSSFWFWCGTVLRWMLILMVLGLLKSGSVRFVQVRNNLMARWNPHHRYEDNQMEGTLDQQRLDIRISQKDRQIRIYRLDLGYDKRREGYFVRVYTVTYANNPWNRIDTMGFELENEFADTGASGYVGTDYYIESADIEKGDEAIVLTIYQLGEDIQVEIPVDWEEIS